MALLWIEGFEKYGAAGDVVQPANQSGKKYWSESDNTMNIVAGRYSGQALRIDATAASLQTPDLSPQDKTLIVGFNFQLVTTNNAARLITLIMPGKNTTSVGWHSFALSVNNSTGNNELDVVRGGTVIDTSTFNGLTANTWHSVEMKVYCDESSGTCNVYVDGAEVISYTGNTRYLTTDNAAYDRYTQVLLRTHVVAAQLYDDLFVMDGTGSTNNDILGTSDFRVETLSPTADVSGNMTPSTGSTFWEIMDEDEADANVVYEDTTGNQILMETSNLTANSATGTVLGVQLVAETNKAARFNKHFKYISQNGTVGSIEEGDDVVPGYDGTGFASVSVMEDDPDGNSWTAATVNSLRIGLQVKDD